MSTTVARDISSRVRVITGGSLPPVVEWRAATTPYAVQSSVSLSGSGYAGSIPLGTNSSIVTIRLYNNFLGAGGIADALTCVLACYDDALHQGSAVTSPVIGAYLQVQVIDYNGVTTGADNLFYAIGGQLKHAIPVNSGTIGGTGANYVTLNIQAAVPAGATLGVVSQGLWVEYTATA